MSPEGSACPECRFLGFEAWGQCPRCGYENDDATADEATTTDETP